MLLMSAYNVVVFNEEMLLMSAYNVVVFNEEISPQHLSLAVAFKCFFLSHGIFPCCVIFIDFPL